MGGLDGLFPHHRPHKDKDTANHRVLDIYCVPLENMQNTKHRRANANTWIFFGGGGVPQRSQSFYNKPSALTATGVRKVCVSVFGGQTGPRSHPPVTEVEDGPTVTCRNLERYFSHKSLKLGYAPHSHIHNLYIYSQIMK